MANVIPIFGALPGSIGSSFVAVVNSSNVPPGNYVISQNNFPGLGSQSPGWVFVIGNSTTNMTMQMSTDNGSNWITMVASPNNAGLIFMDNTQTFRIVVQGGNVNGISFFCLGTN